MPALLASDAVSYVHFHDFRQKLPPLQRTYWLKTDKLDVDCVVLLANANLPRRTRHVAQASPYLVVYEYSSYSILLQHAAVL
jgi:hypothetical protein